MGAAVAVLVILLLGIIFTLFSSHELPIFANCPGCGSGREPSDTENADRLASLADIINTDHADKLGKRGLHNIFQGICKASKEIGVDKRPDRTNQRVEPNSCLRVILLRCLYDTPSVGIPDFVMKDIVYLVGDPFSNRYHQKPGGSSTGRN
ncbi:hypothetical protein HG531_002002 [Fusarium graminearum]|nr:hypothetical protein HG531_002002 [Fusarium graminearum]